MAKADSNYEKTGIKSRLTVPLKSLRKSHMTPRSIILRRDRKIRISRRKRNNFNPLVNGPGRFER